VTPPETESSRQPAAARDWPNIPFAPARVPLYYGWVVLILGSVGFVMSSPGQTVGVSVFTDFLIQALGLSRVDLSLAYLIGTAASALLLSSAGRVYDRFGARVVGTVVAVGLGSVLIVLSRSDGIVDALSRVTGVLSRGLVAFAFMSVGFFLLRFFGQGVLTLVSRNMVMKWFQARRGLANGIMGVFITFSLSYSPRLMSSLIDRYDWNGAWFSMGLVIGLGFTGIFVLLARDNPASCGLEPDGKAGTASKRRRAPIQPERDFTLKEARRTLTFWAYTATLFTGGLFFTGLTFHIVSIFANAGMSRLTAVSIFFPASIISISLNFLVSWASDYIKLKYILIIQIVGLALGAVALIDFGLGLPYVLLIVGTGMNGGTFTLISTVTWPRFFGLSHMGAISGFVTGSIVGGSAVGPYLFSLSLEYTGSYAGAGLLCLGVVAVLLLLALKADKPAHPAGAKA